ncbi:MAG: alanine--glyoxylate aminotransferase family protein [Nitrospinae bacterium]|nr:alanine--glyoxylate aminotransferase family protein [Nitrospinota bacterium]
MSTKKTYLLAPGPTPIPPEVLAAMGQPILHHRAPEYGSILEEVRAGLKYLFQTDEEVVMFASSGTGGMEAAVVNVLSPGDKAICIGGGKFSERWQELCEAYGIEAVPIDVEWGSAVNPTVVADTLQVHPDAKAVYVQASETSTGVRHDVEALAQIVRPTDAILVVDAITAIGVFDVPTDSWGLDIVISGSQKALMLPPGLGFCCVATPKAWELVKRSTLPKYYFDLKKEYESLRKNSSAYTPAVSLVVGLREALRRIQAEGLEQVFARHDRLARATRSAMQAIGLELFAKDSPSNAVTAVKVPEGIDGTAIPRMLRDDYGITIAGGQSQLKGKIFRIAHLGYAFEWDVMVAVAATEMVLRRLGYDVELGTGVRAAQQTLLEG